MEPAGRVDDHEELVGIRPRHLRDHAETCWFRRWCEVRGRRGEWIPGGRYDVANRIREDVTLAHTELRTATLGDFPLPDDLVTESQQVYAAAARGYVGLFGDRPARVDDVDRSVLGDFAEFGVRLLDPLGIALRTPDGSHELLRLQIRGERPSLPDDLTVLAARAARWAGAAPVRTIAADLLAFDFVEVVLDDPALVAAGEARIAQLARDALDLAERDEPTPTPGSDCRDCKYLPACPAFRGGAAGR